MSLKHAAYAATYCLVFGCSSYLCVFVTHFPLSSCISKAEPLVQEESQLFAFNTKLVCQRHITIVLRGRATAAVPVITSYHEGTVSRRGQYGPIECSGQRHVVYFLSPTCQPPVPRHSYRLYIYICIQLW